MKKQDWKNWKKSLFSLEYSNISISTSKISNNMIYCKDISESWKEPNNIDELNRIENENQSQNIIHRNN